MKPSETRKQMQRPGHFEATRALMRGDKADWVKSMLSSQLAVNGPIKLTHPLYLKITHKNEIAAADYSDLPF